MSSSRPEPSSSASSRRPEGSPVPAEAASPKPEPQVEAEEAPTIISRPARHGAVPENHFTGLLRGRRLAHFEMEDTVGVGGMAAVIRARDTQLDRQVALKILPPEMAADLENVRRFQHEARAAAKLDHEHIARVFYCGEDQGLHFIAFEYVEGQNLRVLIEKQGTIPIAEAIHYTLQIATGLAHAAARGVIHRDIKPSNIIISDGGRAKLVDMGLARSLDTRSDQGLTHSGVTLGTFDYISPEQAMEPREADVRSDIYSLGCTLYHMLTGHAPVPEGTAAKKLQFQQHGQPVDPRQINPRIPDEVAAVLSKMMAKDPRGRYQNPEHLVSHLLLLAQQLAQSGGSSAKTGVLFVESVVPTAPKLRPVEVLLAAGAALVLLVCLLGLLGGPDSSSSSGNARGRPSQPKPPDFSGDSGKRVVRSVSELRTLLQSKRSGTVQLQPAPNQVFELWELTGPADEIAAGLVFSRCDLLIEPAPGTPRPVIRASSQLAPPRAVDQAAMTLRDGRLVLRGLQLEIEGSGPGGPLHALLELHGGTLVLEDCIVVEKRPRGSASAVAAIRVAANSNAGWRPAVEARGCYFAGGDTAFLLDNGARIEASQCLIGPYDRPVRLNAEQPGFSHSDLAFSECTWLVGPQPLIRLDDEQSCEIEISRSVLAHADADRPADPIALLHYGRRNRIGGCRLIGRGNSYWLNTVPVAEWEDSGSRHLTASPWARPITADVLNATMDPSALRINLTAPALRPEGGKVVGARKGAWGDLYPDLEHLAGAGTPGTPRPPARKELVVGSDEGNYPNLQSALGAALADDSVTTIILKVSGEITTPPLDIGKKRIVLKAGPRHRPILRLDTEQVPARDGELFLFRVHDGELTLEDLDFVLEPGGPLTQSESVVAITGTGRCRIHRCRATLDGAEGPKLALVSVSDLAGAMMGPAAKPRPGTPVIELSESFVRGHGDLVAVKSSRPLTLDAKQCLVAVTGSLLAVDGTKPELIAGAAAGIGVTLSNVTAHVGQHLLLARGTKEARDHVPIDHRSTDCVFSTEGRALVALHGPESKEEVKRLLGWRANRNVYSTTGAMLLLQPIEAMGMDMPKMADRFDFAAWEGLWGGDEAGSRFGRIKFAAFPPLDGRDLADARPDDFRIQSPELLDPEFGSRGADLERLIRPGTAGNDE